MSRRKNIGAKTVQSHQYPRTNPPPHSHATTNTRHAFTTGTIMKFFDYKEIIVSSKPGVWFRTTDDWSFFPMLLKWKIKGGITLRVALFCKGPLLAAAGESAAAWSSIEYKWFGTELFEYLMRQSMIMQRPFSAVFPESIFLVKITPCYWIFFYYKQPPLPLEVPVY